MLSCDEARELLSAYYDNELDLIDQVKVAEHLKHCPACQQELDALRQISVYFNEVTSLPSTDAFRASLHEKLVSQATKFKKGNGRRVPAWLRDWKMYGSAAACLVLCIGVYAAVANHSLSPSTAVPVTQSDIQTSSSTSPDAFVAAPDSSAAQPQVTVQPEGQGSHSGSDTAALAEEPSSPQVSTDPSTYPAVTQQPVPDPATVQAPVMPTSVPTLPVDTGSEVQPAETGTQTQEGTPNANQGGKPDNNEAGAVPSENDTPTTMTFPQTTDTVSGSGNAGGSAGPKEGEPVVPGGGHSASGGGSSARITSIKRISYFVANDEATFTKAREVVRSFGHFEESNGSVTVAVLNANYQGCMDSLLKLEGVSAAGSAEIEVEISNITEKSDYDNYRYITVNLAN